MKEDDGTLRFGTAVDMSGFDEGMNQIEQKVTQIGDNVELESSRIAELLNKVPNVNIDFVTNASQSLSTIDSAFAEIDGVVNANKEAIRELESEYERLSHVNVTDEAEIELLNQQKQAIQENIVLRKQIISESEKVADTLAQTEQSIRTETEAVISSGTTIREQLGSIATECDKHEAAIAKLQQESQNLLSQMGKEFSSGDDKEYVKLKQKREAIEQEISSRKKSLTELRKQSNALEEEASKLEQATQKAKSNTTETEKNTQKQASLRQRLRELKIELVEMEAAGQRGTAQYRALQKEAAKLTDAWGDAQTQANILANDQRGMQGIISGLTGVSGAFTAAQGAVSLFTGENEELQKVMLKVQSLMAITMGLQQVQQTLNKDSAFTLVTLNGLKEWWNKLTGNSAEATAAENAAIETNTAAQQTNTAATNADTAAQTANNSSTVAGTVAQAGNAVSTQRATAATIAQTIATKAATLALKGLKAALVTTGIGAVVVLIGELVNWIGKLVSKSNESKKAFEEQQKLVGDSRKSYISARVAIDDYVKRIENFNGTAKEEKALIEKLNSEYGSQMNKHKTLAKWKQTLTTKGEAYCRALEQEALAQAYLNKYIEAYINLLEVQENIAAGKYHSIFNSKSGDKRADNKALKEAQDNAKKYLDLYRKTQDEANNIRQEAGLNLNFDITSGNDTTGGIKFDAKKAAREYKKIYDDYVKEVKGFIKTANAQITEQQIAASGEGLIRELNDIQYSTYQKEQAWKEQLRQLAEIRKNAVKEQYLTKKGNTEDTWEQTDESKKSVKDYEKELLYNPDGTQTELAKKYFEVLNGITAQGESQILKTRQQYYDEWVKEYGTTAQKIELLDISYTKKLNEIPAEFHDQLYAAWDEAIGAIKLGGLKKELNWEEIFGDLDGVASSSLENLKTKLQEYIKKQKDLSPKEMKEIVDAIKNIDSTLTSRNPFKTLGKSFDNLKVATKAVKEAQDKYNLALEEGTEEEQENAKASLDAARNVKQKALSDTGKALQGTVSKMQEIYGATNDVMGMFESFGVEMPEELTGFVSGMGDVLNGLGSIDLTNPVSIISGATTAIGGLAKGISSLFNHDARKEKRIQKLQEQIDDLQDAYDKLEKSIDNVYSKDASNLINQQNKMLKQQKLLIQNQIKEEESKKHTDKDRIKEWQEQIEEIDELIADNKEAAIDAIFGEDLKSAIENFADAYAEAWASGEDRAKSAKDVVKSMMKQMVTESIKAAIQSSGAIERIREQLESFYSDGILSDWEQNYVMRMAEELQEELDKQFGWADSLLSDEDAEREGTSRGIATASQESVDENNARLTTIQEHTYTLVQGMGELNRTSSAILDKVTGIEKNTSEANTKLDTMSKGVKEIKDAVNDISTRGIKLKT